MKINKKNNCFELRPETDLDCQFIDYIEGANIYCGEISQINFGEQKRKAEVGKNYHIKASIIINLSHTYPRFENKMENGEIIE